MGWKRKTGKGKEAVHFLMMIIDGDKGDKGSKKNQCLDKILFKFFKFFEIFY